MSKEKSCEDCLDEFCRWCYSKVLEIKKAEPEEMKVAKDVLKHALPGGLGEAISQIQTAAISPRDILTLMPEFANKLKHLLDNLCPLHANETVSSMMPLFVGFADVIGFAANQVMNDVIEEENAAEERQRKLDETNLN